MNFKLFIENSRFKILQIKFLLNVEGHELIFYKGLDFKKDIKLMITLIYRPINKES